MSEDLRLELIAPDLDPDELARLTEALHARLAGLDGVDVERPTQAPAPGSKPIMEYVAGQLLLSIGKQIAQPAVDEAKKAVGEVVASWLRGIKSKLIVQVRDKDETVAVLQTNSTAPSSPADPAGAGSGPADDPRPPDARHFVQGRSAVDSEPAPKGDTRQPSPPMVGIRPFTGTLAETAAQKPAPPTPARTAPLHYALLIGNQTFGADSGIAPLACAVNDVQAMRQSLLQFPQFYAEESVRTLIDATHYEIEEAVDDILGKAKDSTVILYYSGHGKTSAVGGDLYLAAANSDARRISVTGVEYARIVRLINQNNARRVGIILDCCYAGMVNRQSKGDVADQLNANTQQAGKGLYVIGASLETQTAMERVSDGLGVLTKVITEGLDSGLADVTEQGQVSFDNLYDYVSRTIGGLSHQVPIRSVSASGTDLVIAPSRHPKLRRRGDLGMAEELGRIKEAMRTSRKSFPPSLFDQIFLSFIPKAQTLGEYIRDDDRYQVLLDFAYKDAAAAKVIEVFDPKPEQHRQDSREVETALGNQAVRLEPGFAPSDKPLKDPVRLRLPPGSRIHGTTANTPVWEGKERWFDLRTYPCDRDGDTLIITLERSAAKSWGLLAYIVDEGTVGGAAEEPERRVARPSRIVDTAAHDTLPFKSGYAWACGGAWFTLLGLLITVQEQSPSAFQRDYGWSAVAVAAVTACIVAFVLKYRRRMSRALVIALWILAVCSASTAATLAGLVKPEDAGRNSSTWRSQY